MKNSLGGTPETPAETALENGNVRPVRNVYAVTDPQLYTSLCLRSPTSTGLDQTDSERSARLLGVGRFLPFGGDS